jgi:hypothetical protein
MESALFLRLGGPEKASCCDVREIAAQHLDDIRAKIGDLRQLEHLLSATVARCSGTSAPKCPVLDILDVQRATNKNTEPSVASWFSYIALISCSTSRAECGRE